MIIRTITVVQPWATLLALGVKIYETRGWKPYQLGALAIHAGKNRELAREFFWQPHYREALEAAGYEKPDDLPYGAIVAKGIHRTTHPAEAIAGKLSARELAFGDFRPGRFAWEMACMQRLVEPIECGGKQSIWDWHVTGPVRLYPAVNVPNLKPDPRTPGARPVRAIDLDA